MGIDRRCRSDGGLREGCCSFGGIANGMRSTRGGMDSGSGALFELRAFVEAGPWVVALATWQGLLVVAEVVGVVAVLESSIPTEACSVGKAN